MDAKSAGELAAAGQNTVGDAYGAQPPSRPWDGRRVLYHYTNEAGVLGIVSSGALHATVARYSNDESEIMHAFQLAARHAAHVCQSERTLHQDVRHGLHEFVKYVREVGKVEPNICIVSFSEDPGVLSQWRGYGGYSVGFDFDVMSRVSEGWRLLKCRYTDYEQSSLVASAVEQSIKDAVASLTDWNQAVQQALFSRVLQPAPAIKHSDFREEREWRLVSPPIDVSRLETRVGRHSLVQYAAKRLPRKDAETLPIIDVVVGPGPHQRLPMTGVSNFLSSNPGAAKWSVRPSQTPFLP